jgi:hypothetical protein
MKFINGRALGEDGKDLIQINMLNTKFRIRVGGEFIGDYATAEIALDVKRTLDNALMVVNAATREVEERAKFGDGKIGMVTIAHESFDLLEEPASIEGNEGISQARAIDNKGALFMVYFKNHESTREPWYAENAEL